MRNIKLKNHWFYTLLILLGLTTGKVFAQTGSTCATALSLTISPGNNTGWQTTSYDTLWYSFTAPNEICNFRFYTSLANKKYLKDIVYGTCGNTPNAYYQYNENDSTVRLRYLNLIPSQTYKLGLVFDLSGQCTSCASIGSYKIEYIDAVAAVAACTASCVACEYICNGSFEQNSAIPQNTSQLTNSCGWRSANSATPDYFSTGAPTNIPLPASIPTNFAGCELPITGTTYAGFLSSSGYYEALVTQLSTTLTIGRTYNISFFLSLGESSPNNINNVAFAFSNNYAPTTTLNTFGSVIAGSTQSVNTSSVGMNGWTQFTYTYTATGNETHFLIGCISPTVTSTSSSASAGTCNQTYLPGVRYYYLEDVSIKETPQFSVTPQHALLCNGMATFSVSPPTVSSSYTWTSSPATASLSSQTGPTITVSPTVTTIYSVNIAGTNSCTTAQSMTVDVQPLSIIPTSTFYCVGSGPVILYAAGQPMNSYTWTSNPPTTGLSSVHVGSVSVKPSVTTTYTVSGSITGCSEVYTATITILVGPTFTISSLNTCVGASVTIGSTSPASGIFYDFDDPGSPGNNTNPHVYTSAGTYVAYVEGTDVATGCYGFETFTINVNPPGVGPTVSINGQSNICSGQSATLTASGAVNYTWTSGPTTSSVVVSPTSTAVYTVTGSDVCGSSTATFAVNVYTISNLSTTNATICSGSNATITASGGAGTYTWSNGSTGSVTVVSPAVSTTYTVTSTSGVCTRTATSLVTVSPPPTLNFNTLPSPTICAGANIVFSSVTGAVTYTWAPCTGATCNNATKSFTNVTANTVYTLSGTDGNGCVGTRTVAITVVPIPTVTAQSYSICAGNSATLTASGATNYTWAPGSSTLNPIVVTPTATSVYTVTGRNAGCNTSSVKTVTVTVSTNTFTTFGIITPASPIVANGTGTNVIGLTTSLSNTTGLTYTWNPGGINTPTTNFNLTQPEVIYLTVSNPACSITVTQSVCVNYVAQACGNTTLTVLNNYTLSSNAQIPNGSYYVTGTLTIDWSNPLTNSIALQSKNFLMKTNAKVRITSNSDITLNNTKFYSCDGMWEGIELMTTTSSAPRITISGDNNSIEDAYKGLYTVNPSATNASPLIRVVDGVLFNKNYYDIYLDRSASTGATYPFYFTKSKMLSENTPNSPGGNLKCSSYYTPTVKSRSYAGLYTTDAGIIDFNIAVNPADNNIIKNKDFGLFFNNTAANVYNVSFSDFDGYQFTGSAPVGTAIRSESSRYLYVKAPTLPAAAAMTFSNTNTGIYTNGTAELDVQDAEFYNPSQYTILGVPRYGIGSDAIVATDATTLLRVNKNLISKAFSGVTAGYTTGPAGGYIGSISQNTIAASTGTVTSAVMISSAVSFSPGTGSMAINGNLISSANNGISVTNVQNGLRCSNNAISIAYFSVGARNGIKLNGCSNVKIDNNTVSSTNTANANLRGIYLQLSPGCKTQCNSVTNTGQAFVFEGNCLSSTDGFINNIIDGARDGMVLRVNGIIGAQGSTGGTPGSSGNQWLGTFSNSKTLVSDLGSSAQNSNLIVRNNSNEYPQPQSLNVRAGTAAPLSDNYGTSAFNFPASIFLVTTANYSCPSGTSSGLRMAQDTMGDAHNKAIQDSTLYRLLNGPEDGSVIPQETRAINRGYVYQLLAGGYQTTHQGLLDFYAEQQDSTIALYSVIDSLLQTGNYVQAQNQNNLLLANDQLSYNQQLANNAIIEYANGGLFTDSTLNELMNLANSCPLQQGKAVYQVRALISTLLGTHVEFTDNCEFEASGERKTKTTTAAKQSNFILYPNPNNGSMYLKYRVSASAVMRLYDISGRMVYEHMLKADNSILQIHTDLHPGVYFYSITNDKGDVLKTDKLIIMD